MDSQSSRLDENNSTDFQNSYISDPPLIFSVFLLSLINIGTILGNVLIIISILKANNIRNRIANRFILSLASSDLLLSLLVMPLAISKLHNHYMWPHGVALCKAWATFDVVFCSASIYNLVGISLERFYAIHWPLRYTSSRSGTMVNVLILFAWMMALAISLPMYIDKPPFGNWNSILYSQQSLENMDCSLPLDGNSMGWIWYAFILAFIIPILLIVLINSLILKKMQTRQNKRVDKAQESVNMAHKTSVDYHHSRLSLDVGCNRDRLFSQNGNHHGTEYMKKQITNNDNTEKQKIITNIDSHDTNDMEKPTIVTILEKKKDLSSNIITVAERKLKIEMSAQKRITMMMSVVIGTFLLCWAPFTMMFILFPHSEGARIWLISHPAVVDLITWIGYLNSFVNPIIYTIMNMEIRNSVKGIFSDIRTYLNVCCKLES